LISETFISKKGEVTMAKTVKQISVFLENHSGQLADLAKILSDNNIDMRTLSIAEAADFGIVRMIVNDTDKTMAVLKEAGYVSSITPVIAVAVRDEPGGLYEILDIMRKGDINLEYAYAFIAKKQVGAYLIFHVSDTDTEKAVEVLLNNNINLITQKELDDI